MNNEIKRIRYKKRPHHIQVGIKPGSIDIPEGALKPVIIVYSYNEKELISSEGKTLEVILSQFKKCPDHTHWIQVKGLGDAKLIEEIGDHFEINPLVLEDITNTHQRPKFDEYDNYVFSTSRIIDFNKENELTNCQFSALVKKTLSSASRKRMQNILKRLKQDLRQVKAPYALQDQAICVMP
jgi:magnesium transporter